MICPVLNFKVFLFWSQIWVLNWCSEPRQLLLLFWFYELSFSDFLCFPLLIPNLCSYLVERSHAGHVDPIHVNVDAHLRKVTSYHLLKSYTPFLRPLLKVSNTKLSFLKSCKCTRTSKILLFSYVFLTLRSIVMIAWPSLSLMLSSKTTFSAQSQFRFFFYYYLFYFFPSQRSAATI